jgi:glucokinase
MPTSARATPSRTRSSRGCAAESGRCRTNDWFPVPPSTTCGNMGARPVIPNRSRSRSRSSQRAPARIAKAALANASPRCSRALDRFVTFYGQSAQALALTALATGGMFVGGGIAPKILPALIDGRFMAAFRTHPHLEELLGAIPVKVALDDRASLLGAVALAARTLR